MDSDSDELIQNGRSYTDEQLFSLVSEVKDYQLTHGSLLKLVAFETESSITARPVGASILPTVFSRERFEEAIKLQTAFNELYVRAASDPDWLYSVIKPLIEHDDFIAALWDIYVKVRDAGTVQSIVCGVFRSDYMLHQSSDHSKPELKQVEMNSFSCAGACHAEIVAKMHNHLERVRSVSYSEEASISHRLPTSDNIASIVTTLKAAHDLYTTYFSADRPKCVLMTVQPHNFNIADERPIEYGLWDSSVACYRCEWHTLLQRTTLTKDRGLLFCPTLGTTELEVSVIYYRGGYDAAEYRDLSKETRVRCEMSRAIKCPDILTHLTTFKAVQQALTQPGAVERFLPLEKAESIRKTFMPIKVLDSSLAGLEVRKIALDPKQAANYVLKPNLEGGGHNIYRTDIPDFLSTKLPEEWHRYVLMRLIEPPATTGTIMMPSDLYHGRVVSELGILGTCLWERKEAGTVELLRNEVPGWTYKTKPEDVDEMSVVKGYGCFDCPLLME